MVQPRELIAIGYWHNPDEVDRWPRVEDSIDPEWDVDERDFIEQYVRTGLVARAYMGYSTCRICGKTDNGDLDLSDCKYVWPSGLAHYIREHDVRLPQWFVKHAMSLSESLEDAERNSELWESVNGSGEFLEFVASARDMSSDSSETVRSKAFSSSSINRTTL